MTNRSLPVLSDATLSAGCHADLTQAAQAMIADAKLSAQRLHACPELRLWLLQPDCFQRQFDARAQQRIADHPAYWSLCWPGGLALARWLLDHPDQVRGQTVLDVGSGSGVVAIAAALAGAARVIACDIDPIALMACQQNARLNAVSIEVTDRLYHSVDLVTAADLLYDDSNLGLIDQFRQISHWQLLAESRNHQIAAECASDTCAKHFRAIADYYLDTEPHAARIDDHRHARLFRSV